MERKVCKLFISCVVVFVCMICSFVFREFVEVYNFQMYHLNSNYFIRIISDINTYKIFLKLKDAPNVLSWIILTVYFSFMIMNATLGKKVGKKYKQVENYGSHGTARWQTKKEIKENFYKDQVGWLLGSVKNEPYVPGKKYACHKVEGKLNMQMNVIGPPGSVKTTGFVLPNVLHISKLKFKTSKKRVKEKADLIITDPKSEIYSLTVEALEKQGYEIKVLDFINLEYGDCLNPLDFVDNDIELMELAKGYVESSTSAGTKTNFWKDTSAQLLGALIGLVNQKHPGKNTFTNISKISVSKNLTDEELCEEFFEKNNVKGAANDLYNKFLMSNPKTRSEILIGFVTLLNLFAVDGVQRITNKTTIDIRKIGAEKEKPIALFIFMRDGDETFAPIINVMLSVIVNQLYKTAAKYKNKLHVPVFAIYDEIANIGHLPWLQVKLGTMRGRRIYPMMIWQAISQMKNRYGDKGALDIMGMCDTLAILGSNDEDTSKYVSNKLGPTTIQVQGSSDKQGSIMDVNTETTTSNFTSRPLLFPNEIEAMAEDELILIQRSKSPSKLYKAQYRYWEKKYEVCRFRPITEIGRIVDKYVEIENPKIKVEDEEFEIAKELKEERKVQELEHSITDEEELPVKNSNYATISMDEYEKDENNGDNTIDIKENDDIELFDV